MSRSICTRTLAPLAALAMTTLLGVRPARAAEEVYTIDPVHSGVTFKIRHLTTKTPGEFDNFSGEIRLDRKDPANSVVSVEIDAASINTRNEDRDKHLRSPDFFAVDSFPKIIFKSTKVAVKDESHLVLDGLLTIRGVTKPVALNVEVGGFARDPWGNDRAGFEATTKVNRKDFGIVWNKALDAGGFLLGDDVEIAIAVEAVKKVEKASEAKKG